MTDWIGRALRYAALTTALLTIPALQAATDTRIVSIGAATTELLIALGATPAIVATDVSSQGLPLPKVGYHRALTPEGILSLAPSHLIGSDEMGPPATLDQLTRAGVAVTVLPTAPTLANLTDRIDTLAQLLDRREQAVPLKARIAQDAAELAQLAAAQSPRKVALLILHKGQPISLAGGDSTGAALIQLAGGTNLGQDLKGYKPISSEALIKMQPDLVLVSGRDWQRYQDSAAVLAEVPALTATPAGKNGAIYGIDGHALLGGLSLGSLAEARKIAHWLKETQ